VIVQPEDLERPSALIFNRNLWRSVSRFVRARRRTLVAAVAAAALSSLLLLVQPLVVRSAVDELIKGADFASIVGVLALGGGAALLAALLLWYASTTAVVVARDAVAESQLQLHQRLADLPLEFFSTVRAGTLATRVTHDVDRAEPLYGPGVVRFVTSIVSIVGVTGVMLVVDLRLAVVFALLLIGIAGRRKAERRYQDGMAAQFGATTALANAVEASLTTQGVLLARQAGRGAADHDEFASSVGRLHVATKTMRREAQNVQGYEGLASAAVTAAIVVFGGWLTSSGRISPGTFLLALLFSRQLQAPIAEILNLRWDMQHAAFALERVCEILDTPIDVGGSSAAAAVVTVPTHRVPDSDAPLLAFHAVSFSYPTVRSLALSAVSAQLPLSMVEAPDATDSRPVLCGLSFDVWERERVALVGQSGQGKSTIAMLAGGLFMPTGGAVCVRGRPTTTIPTEELAGQVALLTQDVFLRHDTIRNNLLYVDPFATDERLNEVCDKAGLAHVLAAAPDGLDTVVGERGVRLSGGERQRFAIARILLRDPALVILDEPTSHLDAETEETVKRAIEDAFSDRAMLVIAHRLSTIENCDRVLVLEDGMITEEGTHAELAARGGRYFSLYGTALPTR
jgi:ATP-binding cassette subfamily B protein